ncbi:MAG TPA: DUF6600 domain-containing protein [bacterium]
MRLTHSVVGIVTVVALLLIPLGPLLGSQSVAQAQTPDPPGRVGRLSYVTGQVSFAPSGGDDWAPAVLNYPLTTGTALWTDTQARAELHIGSTAVRMDEYTELDVLNLDDQAVQLRAPQGTMEVSLRRLTAGDRFEVATPAASVTLVQPGRYRLQVDDSGLRLTVWAGQAEVATSSYAFVVPAVQTVLIVDSSSGGGYQVIRTPQMDEFGSWCLARDREEAGALQLSAQYAPPMMTGVEDLAAYGSWRTLQGYGWGWFPRVQSNWAPYRYGRWVWVSPWGWTWIDNARWGFAPFHYGRWVLIGGLWAWIPGPVHVRPVFAPALVVFVVIGGSMGWFPLAPQDVYVPAYPVSPRYFQTVNVTVININIYNIRTVNVTNITYVYRHNRKGVTWIHRDRFVGANAIGAGWIARPTEREFSRAGVYAASPVRPDLKSVLGRSKHGATPTPPRNVERRFVVVRETPPVVTPPKIAGVELNRRFTPVKPAVAKQPDRAAPSPPASHPGVPTPSPAQQPPGVTTPRAPQQPGFASPRPAPQPPAMGPAPQGPQNRPNPAGPENPNKPSSCNPRSPIYDPQQCPPQAPQQHPGQPPAPQPRTMQPAAPPQPAQPVVPQPGFGAPRPAPQPPQVSPAPQGPENRPNPNARGNPAKPFSCDPRSQIYDPQRCPPQAPQEHPGQPPAQPGAPQPRTTQPTPPPQPGFGAPRPTPQPPQVSPAPQGPQNHSNQNGVKWKQGKKVSCDPRSPDYDPRQCPSPGPKR